MAPVLWALNRQEGVLKNDGIVPKRSSGSVSGIQESEDLWRAEREGSNESGREERVKTPVRGLVLGKSA